MTERKDRSFLDPAWVRSIMEVRLTRRGFLKGAGTGAAAFGLGSLLAACGGGGGGGGGELTIADIYKGEAGDTVNFANWPFYIDQAKDEQGSVYNPSLALFTEKTGITVNYKDVIQANEEFFGRIQPLLEAGDDTGWDVIVITNGATFNALVQNDWVYPLDPGRRPNFDANAADWAKSPFYDPNNEHGMPWQSGLDGLGVNTELVNGPITKLDDLADPDKVGKGMVGMLKYDMLDFTMVNLGIDPQTSGPDDWKAAADWLYHQRDSGTVRQYYGNDYLDELRSGNLSVSMAWSGDVIYSNLWLGYTNLEFLLPEGGGLMWMDNMMIPAGAKNPVGAMEVMDWYYDPKVASMVTEWVFYMSPVPATKELMLQDAQAAEDAGDKGRANKLRATAEDPILYPDAELLSKVRWGTPLKTDEEREAYYNILLPISEG
jgi:spermidine/putrescine transport system substrate-binding protein